ncbi:hypothetical protein ACFLRX_03970 [Acidobacteriota bacterium]
MEKTKLTLVLVMVVLASFSLSAQKTTDLVGTWEGEGTLEGEPDPNVLTLVLNLEEGKFAGHMSDEYGSMMESPVEEGLLEDDTFIFSISVDMGGQPALVKFTMKVDGESMEGKFEIPDMGMMGTWKATKQK